MGKRVSILFFDGWKSVEIVYRRSERAGFGGGGAAPMVRSEKDDFFIRIGLRQNAGQHTHGI